MPFEAGVSDPLGREAQGKLFRLVMIPRVKVDVQFRVMGIFSWFSRLDTALVFINDFIGLLRSDIVSI